MTKLRIQLPSERGRAMVLGVFVMAMLGCAPSHPTDRDLVGTWSTAHNFGRETLTLAADHSYSQCCKATSGSLVKNTGRWTLVTAQAAGRGSTLEFQAALVFVTPFGERADGPTPRTVRLEALRNWGRLELSFNPDLPGFTKQN
jgi:hypothetical protein